MITLATSLTPCLFAAFLFRISHAFKHCVGLQEYMLCICGGQECVNVLGGGACVLLLCVYTRCLDLVSPFWCGNVSYRGLCILIRPSITPPTHSDRPRVPWGGGSVSQSSAWIQCVCIYLCVYVSGLFDICVPISVFSMCGVLWDGVNKLFAW